MANTYTQLYVQLVFAVKGRESLLPRQHREVLHRYITGTVHQQGHKLLAVFAMPDHVHLLVGLKPHAAISDLVRDIKAGSSKLINEQKWLPQKFSWQEGYGAFSYSRSQVDAVVQYILTQEEHHRKKTFREEYVAFLQKFQVEYQEQYLFEWLE